MRLAVFYPASLWCAWACSYGLVNTLRRMGHEVTPFPIDPQHPTQILKPNAADFNGAVISGPEHIGKYISAYGNMPTVAWLHESLDRPDYCGFPIDSLHAMADIVFCPGIQDEKCGFRYLPFGVDMEIFHPDPKQDKTIDAAFIGLMYPKRQEFLAQLKPHMNGTKLTIGNVQVLEVNGINPRKTAELYALNIRSIKVFVNLPTLSQLAVTKIYEVLACGTPIITPEVSDMRNLEGLPVVTYKSAPELAELLKCTKFTAPGDASAYMYEHHRLELRCKKLIEALKEVA